ncbi:trehalase family glycosidase [Parapedobacter defluvii]|uniref:MGH1-like glycoside hydrolase domain-containing protein n=1 Tax=Parapedobacter defluvii TaxID=2045106 RepID=UPI0033424B27
MTLLILLSNIMALWHPISTHADTITINTDVPVIKFPGISQSDFSDAFNVLNECLVRDEPRHGFSQPFIAPGGHYGGCWWQLDASLSLHGTKWVDQRFSENMLRGFSSVQKDDGRIPLYGIDDVPGYPTGSSLPKLFQAADAVLRQAEDKDLKQSVYLTLKKYMDWWFSDARRDAGTGLITGVFEESFPPVEKELKAVAQVDLNVEIVIGCHVLAELAKELGYTEDHRRYTGYQKELRSAINQYMWDEVTGAYYSYHVKDKKLDSKLICYTFDPFRMQIAPPDRTDRMIAMLTDDKYFNWSKNAVTSAAKTGACYTETRGPYDGAPSWSGSIWTLRNEVIIEGLEDIERYDLSAYLALKTVRLFNDNYTEFVNPTDGSGHGVQRYAWSAAQYIQILVEKIFGLDYDRQTKTIRIRPNLDSSLVGEKISLEGLLLANGSRLNLHIDNRTDSVGIAYSISGDRHDLNIVVGMVAEIGKKVKITVPEGRRIKAKRTRQKQTALYEVANKNHTGEFVFVTQEER